MECKLCTSNNVKMVYRGLIRDGMLGKYTKNPVSMWQCEDCGVIWHDSVIDDTKQYYESKEYRDSLEGSSDIEDFYKNHDKETLDKFQYTGTDIFRHKVVSDIGCGGGAFLDFLKGVADTVIAIEPSEEYRHAMDLKGFETYAYAEDATKDWKGKVDIITSFDVIEHVKYPQRFMSDVFELLAEGGHAIIGTPTDAPIMRSILGEVYERKLLFSTQHLWIYSKKSLEIMAKNVGFKQIETRYFQRYGMSNFVGWLNERQACGNPEYFFISESMDKVWKSELSRQGISDYIVLYLKKGGEIC